MAEVYFHPDKPNIILFGGRPPKEDGTPSNVGGAFYQMVQEHGFHVPAVFRSDHFAYSGLEKRSDQRVGTLANYVPDQWLRRAQAVAIATPSDGSGNTITFNALEAGVPVIPAEKHTLATYPNDIRKLGNNGELYGSNATCGGGSLILESARPEMDDSVVAVYMEGNATLNDFGQRFSPVRPNLRQKYAGIFIDQLIDMGAAEPFIDGTMESREPMGIINGEIEDLNFKRIIAEEILFGQQFGYSLGSSIDKTPILFTPDSFSRYLSEAHNLAFLVSYERDRPSINRGVGMSLESNGWYITMGLVNIHEHPFFTQSSPEDQPHGLENAIMVVKKQQDEVVYKMLPKGMGALPIPTAEAMVFDLEKRVRRQIDLPA